MDPLVSVVIPCYKYGKYLNQCIDSVLGQTYLNVEVIVVNDKSPDDTSAIVRNYSGVNLIEHEVNKGLAASRNTGVRAARGEYVLCLDADDYLAPECIEKCVWEMAHCDVVCPGQQCFEGGHDFWPRDEFCFTLKDFLANNQIHCASLFRKSFWEKIGGFDESMKLGFEDWSGWISMVEKGARIRAVNQPLFWYRVHADSMQRTVTTPDRYDEIFRYMRRKHPGFTAGIRPSQGLRAVASKINRKSANAGW